MPEQQPKKSPWYYQPWLVILMLFVVLGPFGLPLVFKSPNFRLRTKIFLTVLTLAYTAYLIWVTVKATEAVSGMVSALYQTLYK